jgi:hypothetical protein
MDRHIETTLGGEVRKMWRIAQKYPMRDPLQSNGVCTLAPVRLTIGGKRNVSCPVITPRTRI